MECKQNSSSPGLIHIPSLTLILYMLLTLPET